VSEFFKSLLDIESSEKKPEFLDLFYSTVLTQFTEFINTDIDSDLISEHKDGAQMALTNSILISKSLVL
jgi:hypothetical protein